MVHLSELEEKWRKRWEHAKLFEADADRKKKKFFLTFPYPYMNGYLHIGHFYTLMKVEAFARYKRMQGYNVLFPQGWHCTGSPIENAAQRIREKEQSQWENMRKMGFSDAEIAQFAEPKHWAEYFPEQARQDLRAMGLSIDFRRSFITTDLNPHYDAFIRWQFRKLKEKGYVQMGKHPVVWCLKDNSPVSDHSRVEGEGETPQEFTLLKFGLEDKFLVAATLRPETVYGLTNVWISPSTLYVEARVDEEVWIVSRECAEKLKEQEHHVEITGTILGRQLIGKTCMAPLINLPMMILPSSFCDPAKGTGIVMSVPSDSPDDWMGLRDLQKNEAECRKYNLDWDKVREIKPIPIIRSADLGECAAVTVCEQMKINSQHERLKLQEAKKLVYKKGYYEGVMAKATGRYAGMKVEKAKDMVKNDLLKREDAMLFYELTGKVVCRCLTPSIIKIVSNQWFITYSDQQWKKLASKALKQLVLYPEKARQQFEYVIGWLNDWACTREYGLGTKLPWDKQWVIESLSDSTIYMAYYTVAHLIKDIPVEHIDDALFDWLFLGKGKKPGIKGIDALKEEFAYWYPVDFRNSGKDLIQNHLTFYLFNHTAIFPEKHWPKGIGVNGWVTVDGQKMSKSLGNVILLRNLSAMYSVDAARFTIMSGGEGLDDPNWDSEFARSIRGKLEQFYDFALEQYGKGRKEQLPIDTWMESKLHEVIQEMTGHMELTVFRSALQKGFFDLQKAIRWYLKRSANKPQEKLFKEVLEAQVSLLAPFTPFLCEELWKRLGKKGFVSTAAWPSFDKRKITLSSNAMEGFVGETAEDIVAVLKLAKIEKPKRITLFAAEPWKHKLFFLLSKELEKTRNIGEIQKALLQTELKRYGQEIMKMVPRLVQSGTIKAPILDQDAEQKALQNAAAFFYEEFGADITIVKAQDSTLPKARMALPGKAAILVE